MLNNLLQFASLALAAQYELVAIHSDSDYQYSLIQFDPKTRRMALKGSDLTIELKNGELISHTADGQGSIAVSHGYPLVNTASDNSASHSWSLADEIYLTGTYWLCDDEINTISIGDIAPHKSCNNPTRIQLFAHPLKTL